MIPSTILRSQANQILQILEAGGWRAADFEWEEVPSRTFIMNNVARLRYRSSGFFFTFDSNGSDKFYVKCSPWAETVEGFLDAKSWNGQIDLFGRWLNYLSREITSPDLWASISQEANLIESAADDVNTQFTAEEKSYILSGLDEIKQYLLTAHKIDPELLEGRIKYLIEASERMGRKDWINILVSVLISIVIQTAFSPAATRELFGFVSTVLGEILKHPPIFLTA